MEEWKPIKGYEGLYEVSNLGRVKSLNYLHTGKEGILKANKDNDGYLYVNLYKNNKMKSCTIHRLVAIAFVENPEGYNEVNHIDKNRENSKASNLEWCSRQYNVDYSQSKAVIGIDKVSGLIVEFISAKEAARQIGIDNGNISKCCKGKRNSAGGFLWFYAE